MPFETVINGIIKYMDKEIFSAMNDWQEMLARIATSRMLANAEQIKTLLNGNTFLKTFAIMDVNGNVDIVNLLNDVQTYLRSKGTMEVNLPMFGKFRFTEADVNKLRTYIMEGNI